MSDDEWYEMAAAELVALSTDTREPRIVILDESGNVAQYLDKLMARALAVKLVEMAVDLPIPGHIWRGDLL